MRFNGEKFLSVERLQKLLAQLDPKDNLFPNTVGNLKIERKNKWYGFIDFLMEGEIVAEKDYE